MNIKMLKGCRREHCQIYFDRPPALQRSILAIGAFDGVHRGHQRLISCAVEDARHQGAVSVIWTFDPPPKVLFSSARNIMRLKEKIAAIAKLGPDMVVVSKFTEEFRKKSAGKFLDEISIVNPHKIHVGENFRFGAGQHGDTMLLKERYYVQSHTLIRCNKGEVISSSRIRNLISRGHVSEAQNLLGHFALPYEA